MDISLDTLWIGIGLFGQALFSLRFLVQWAVSERERRSVIPPAFWHLSIAGSVTLLAYAVHRADPVFIVGQLTGVLIYARNLVFVRRERRRA